MEYSEGEEAKQEEKFGIGLLALRRLLFGQICKDRICKRVSVSVHVFENGRTYGI